MTGIESNAGYYPREGRLNCAVHFVRLPWAGSRSTFFRCWFARKLQGSEHKRGIVSILRVELAVIKLLVIAWSMMKNKETFAYERLHNC